VLDIKIGTRRPTCLVVRLNVGRLIERGRIALESRHTSEFVRGVT
jgi:hypothetical protein